MKIGLFDLYSTGHHLQYASGIKQALEDSSNHEITFITLTTTDLQESYFSTGDVRYLDTPDSPSIEDRSRDFNVVADEMVERFVSTLASNYDVIHFLYIDDILGQAWRHLSASEGPTIVADLIGPFFTRSTISRNRYVHPVYLRLLQSPLIRVIDHIVPKRTTHEASWRDLLLYRSLNESVFDSILVHSPEAKTYVERLRPVNSPSPRFVPHPAPNWSEGNCTQEQARKEFGLPTSKPILLFFGTLRLDKGIDVLLNALRTYEGPEFTMFIAGPPVSENSVDEAEIRRTRRESDVDIHTHLGFITDPEPYYRAADGVVMPYTRTFGRENMSMIFQEACSSLRPVITPDVGALGRLTAEYNLGMRFRQGSSDHLASIMSEFVKRLPLHLENNLREYSGENTYEKLSNKLVSVYEGRCSENISDSGAPAWDIYQ